MPDEAEKLALRGIAHPDSRKVELDEMSGDLTAWCSACGYGIIRSEGKGPWIHDDGERECSDHADDDA